MATLRTDPTTGRETFSGFSWTTLFFGPIPALFRRDWLGAVLWFAVAVIATLLGVMVSGGDPAVARVFIMAVMVVWAAFYNANHAARVAGA